MTPTVGRIVHYRLSEYDAKLIDEQTPYVVDGRQVRNAVRAGTVLSALIVQAWGDKPGSAVNLKVFLDGAGEYWATSRHAGDGEGCWSWPPRVSDARPVKLPNPAVKRFTLPAEDVARICHEANRGLQIATGDPAPSPHWDEAPEWQRASAIDGVSKASEGATCEELHNAWCDFKRADGWTYGPIKDAEAKTHPCLAPYIDLPVEQRVKDDLFQAIVKTLI